MALAVVVTAAAGALSVLISWYYHPYLAASNETLSLSEVSPFAAGLFDLRGVALAGWTLAAFAIGGLAGLLIRRVVPAIIATLAVYAGLALAAGAFLRKHYLTPLVTSKLNVPETAWITSQWGTKGGKFAFTGRAPINLLEKFCPPPPWDLASPQKQRSHDASPTTATRCGSAISPASRFWAFQWIEGGWLLALSVLLIAVTVWLVHRRAT